jgi:hypothetical protein
MSTSDSSERPRFSFQAAGPFQAQIRTHADLQALVAHAAEVTGVTPISPTSIRGHGGRSGGFERQTPGGGPAVSSHDPILDSLTTARGELVIGGQGLPMTASISIATLGTLAQANRATMCVPGPGDLQTCRSADGSVMVFKAGSDIVVFYAYSDSTGPYWNMGARVATLGEDFQRADIHSRYYMPAVAQTCALIYDNDHDSNDDEMDEYEWGINAEKPRRVEALCRVQWHGVRLSGVVFAGEACQPISVDPWPVGYPDDWPPATDPNINPPHISATPDPMTFVARATSPKVTRTLRVSNTFDTPKQVRVDKATVADSSGSHGLPGSGAVAGANPFSNGAGEFTVPARGSVSIPVTFDASKAGGAATGAVRARGRIAVHHDGSFRNVHLEAVVTGAVLDVPGGD